MGLSFQAEPGKVTFLAGPNGVGKTTWMRLATGLAHLSFGKVWYGTDSLEGVRDKIAVSFDEPAVYPHLTGLENLSVISGIENINSKEAKETIYYLGLEGFVRRKAGIYSYGQKKRLSVCSALLRNFDYLLLDEPMIGLDPDAWLLLKDKLIEFKQKEKVLFLTGQNLDAMEPLVDHVVILNRGMAVFDGSLNDLKKRRPPKVKITTLQPEVLREYLNAYIIGEQKNGTIEILCHSSEEAQKVMNNIKSLEISFQSLGITYDSLEEAYRNVIRETSSEERT